MSIGPNARGWIFAPGREEPSARSPPPARPPPESADCQFLPPGRGCAPPSGGWFPWFPKTGGCTAGSTGCAEIRVKRFPRHRILKPKFIKNRNHRGILFLHDQGDDFRLHRFTLGHQLFQHLERRLAGRSRLLGPDRQRAADVSFEIHRILTQQRDELPADVASIDFRLGFRQTLDRALHPLQINAFQLPLVQIIECGIVFP